MEKRVIHWGRLIAVFVIFAVICFVVIYIGTGGRTGQQKGNAAEYSKTGFAFDTTYTITLYQGGSDELLEDCVQKCAAWEQIFSRTEPTSELYQVNQLSHCYRGLLEEGQLQQILQGGTLSFSEQECKELEQEIQQKAETNSLTFHLQKDGSLRIQLSALLAELVDKGLYYGEVSKGAFDIAIEPVSILWNFKAEEPKAPEKEAIQAALPYVDGSRVSVEQEWLTLEIPGAGLDLGGIAKGYIADQLKDYLTGQGVISGLINLGGNVLCIGEKTGGKPFLIGVQQPFAERNSTIESIAVRDQSVVSSGVYERYFRQDGTLYHHILNPETGYPRENDLYAVTIVSERSVDGDGLSTTCFGLGLERGLELVNSLEGVTAVFVTEDGQLHYAEGFSDLLVQ